MIALLVIEVVKNEDCGTDHMQLIECAQSDKCTSLYVCDRDNESKVTLGRDRYVWSKTKVISTSRGFD